MTWLLQLLGLKARPAYAVEMILVKGDRTTVVRTLTTNSLHEAEHWTRVLEEQYGGDDIIVMPVKAA